MHVLVTDSFCSANRGDAAILDAMVRGLRAAGATVEVVSHFPALALKFHGVPAVDDRDPVAVARAVHAADFVVSCGGSFLHDLYAPNLNARLATLHLARRAGIPYAIFGQSVGPLVSPLSRQACREVLDGATWICVRDEASARVVRELGVGAPLRVGVDAAVGGRSRVARKGDGPVLGVTVRGWHFPGLADPAARQDAYEAAVAGACDRWARATGGSVRFISNCTSLGGYRQDDRVAARRVAARMVADAEVMEAADLDFATVRGECGACDLFLGTRMHSLIFATTAGVPSVGVAYEQKTYEWMRAVGCPDEVVGIEAPGALGDKLLAAWARREELGAVLQDRVDHLRGVAREDMDLLVRVARGERPERPSAARRDGAGWDGETWRFDLAHRRLRQVADVVAGEGRGRVLDLGCSTGLLGRMLGPAFDYTGIDVAASVATRGERFSVRTGSLDDFAPDGTYDVVVASGSLEYVADLEHTLAGVRGALRPGGLAVLTLFNLAHFARAAGHLHRHPAWTIEARPDDFAVLLRQAGLRVDRVLPTGLGHGPAPAVSDDRPTAAEVDGAVMPGAERLLRLAHQLVFVCRAVEPAAGPSAIEAQAAAGNLTGALHAALAQARALPWASRAWNDLAVLWHAVGQVDRAREAVVTAFTLDPVRPDVRENVDALALDIEVDDAETAVMVEPSNADAWRALVAELQGRGQVASAVEVAALARRRRAA